MKTPRPFLTGRMRPSQWLLLCTLLLLVGLVSRPGWAQTAVVCSASPAVKLAIDGLPQQTPALT